ncbi:MAG: hypothetical protein IJZ40_02160 [Bacteroidaceae bacterium]|nr:hypothetical protein [Bacteroidaceae bacterium]
MPRQIKEIKVIAIDDGKNPVKYLTDEIATYSSPTDFMRCRLAPPHKESFEIRFLSHNSYEVYRPWFPNISEEEFNTMFRHMVEFDQFMFYDPELYMKYFNILWEGGGLTPC